MTGFARVEKWLPRAICIALAALVWMVFGQTRGFEFVNYDDPQTVYLNSQVAKGLTLNGLGWAFTHAQIGHWDPVTTLSHMLVAQICGLAPGGHHLGNVVLHAAAAILLFLLLREMTGALWRSAFAATLFAIHPLRVESVAWVTERKDVLSGVFFMLTLLAYVRWVRQPPSARRYGAVVLLFALGLMSKSMLVTVPFVLLLLDYWPLGRFGEAPARADFFPTLKILLREKVPLFAMAAVFALIQLFANQEGLVSAEKIPLWVRAGNAFVSYAAYLGQMFYPANLAVFYPHPGNALPMGKTILSLLLLGALTPGAYALRKTRPYLLTGWLWYLGMLVPVIGLVQSGDLARADRYTYLPQIGLYVLLAWAWADLCANLRHRALLSGSLAAGAIAALALAAHRQTSQWRDNQTLWTHVLACSPNNAVAHDHLGDALSLAGQGEQARFHYRRAVECDPGSFVAQNNFGLALFANDQADEAILHFRKALEISPDYAIGHNNLANALVETGQLEEAIGHYRRAIEIDPDFAAAEANLGIALVKSGRVANAIAHYERALEIQPDYAKAHANLASALLQDGRTADAIPHFQRAAELQPASAPAQASLANALLRTGAAADAIAHLQSALDLDPHFPAAQANLAWLLATHPDAALRDGKRAVTLAEAADQATGSRNRWVLSTLAAAYAEAGRYAEAVETAQKALQLPETQANDPQSRKALEAQLAGYASGAAFHEEPALNESQRAQLEFQRLAPQIREATRKPEP